MDSGGDMTSKQIIDGLISDCCREVVKINRQEQKSIEDVWTEGVLNQVLRRLCAGGFELFCGFDDAFSARRIYHLLAI